MPLPYSKALPRYLAPPGRLYWPYGDTGHGRRRLDGGFTWEGFAMFWLLSVVTGVGLVTVVLARLRRRLALRGAAAAAAHADALFLSFVRASGEPMLASLPDDGLLALGRATAETLSEHAGNVDFTMWAAQTAGAPREVVLPVVIGAGFFLRPEFKDDVKQIGVTDNALGFNALAYI